MCHHTQSDYRLSNPPLRLTGWVRGLRMICHTTNNPAPSISTVRRRGREWGVGGGPHVVALLIASLAVRLRRRVAFWISLVTSADMRTDSCQRDVPNQSAARVRIASRLPLSLSPSDRRAANPVSLFLRFFRRLQWVSVTSPVLTSAHQQTTPVFIFVHMRCRRKNTPRWEECGCQ